jgi:RNA polymerase sigma-70 factor (ECF subfamily)
MSTSKKVGEIIPTNATLLDRIKNMEDGSSWLEFYSTYRNLIYGVARKSGMTDQEAEDVVQETMLAAAKYIKNFQYDPSRSFKAWLLKITKTKVADQFRARLPIQTARPRPPGEADRTKTVERVPNPTGYDIAARWEEDWRLNLRDAALDRLRRTENAKQYQLFEAHVIKGWPVKKVMDTFGVKAEVVYQNKKRMTSKFQEKISRLQEQLD